MRCLKETSPPRVLLRLQARDDSSGVGHWSEQKESSGAIRTQQLHSYFTANRSAPFPAQPSRPVPSWTDHPRAEPDGSSP